MEPNDPNQNNQTPNPNTSPVPPQPVSNLPPQTATPPQPTVQPQPITSTTPPPPQPSTPQQPSAQPNTQQAPPAQSPQPPTQPETPSEQEPSHIRTTSRLFAPLIGILLSIAVIFIGYFIYAQSFSGSVEYETDPLTFSSGQATQTISRELSPAGNPFRPQVSLKYQRRMGGINIGSTLLSSYTITINNQSQQSIYQDSGSFSFRDADSDEDSGTSTVTTSTNSKDFLIVDSGQYQISFTAQIPEDLDNNFEVESIKFRLRSQVKSAPVWMLLVGITSLFAMIAIIVIKRRSKKNQNT